MTTPLAMFFGGVRMVNDTRHCVYHIHSNRQGGKYAIKERPHGGLALAVLSPGS